MFNVIILGFASLLTDISSEMIYPLLPLYLVNVLGASPAILG
ncbi:MAG: MFS transporter, partial [Candidatus Omnitrophota bacterium]|nr:MFS transporter [Candidatus Omnitrophota bacterium]